jgi:hypothetical protein
MTKDCIAVRDQERWPSGDSRALAVLNVEPSTVAELVGFDLQYGRDELGEFEGAGLRLASGRLIAFVRYKDVSMAGTTIFADAQDDGPQALEEVLRLCSLDEAAILWRNEPL